jgi:transcriptional regulator with XRE-family HTH domain
MELGERILEYRARHGLSQEEFANLVQVNVMTINAIENGKRKPLRITVKRIEMILQEDEENA